MDTDSTQILPRDIFSLIFSFLDPDEVIKCSFVCRLWSEHTKCDYLWQRLCEDGGFDEHIPIEDSWRETYIKHVRLYPKILKDWKWGTSASAKDPSVLITRNGLEAKRESGGHNPSVRGAVPLTGCQKYYFQVLIEQAGAWVSFGFCSEQFGVSAREHSGKGKASCAYYSDSVTHRVFCPGYDDIHIKEIRSGDTIGIMLDMHQGSATFYQNGVKVSTVSNPIWSNNPNVLQDCIKDVHNPKWYDWMSEKQVKILEDRSQTMDSQNVVNNGTAPTDPITTGEDLHLDNSQKSENADEMVESLKENNFMTLYPVISLSPATVVSIQYPSMGSVRHAIEAVVGGSNYSPSSNLRKRPMRDEEDDGRDARMEVEENRTIMESSGNEHML